MWYTGETMTDTHSRPQAKQGQGGKEATPGHTETGRREVADAANTGIAQHVAGNHTPMMQHYR
jgi:hypothetical protein